MYAFEEISNWNKIKSTRKINEKARKERRQQNKKLKGSDNLKKKTKKYELSHNLLARKELTHFCKVFIEFLKPEDVHVI